MPSIAEMERVRETLEDDLDEAYQDLEWARNKLMGASLDRKKRLLEAAEVIELFNIAAEYAEQLQILKALIAETKKTAGTVAA